VTDGTPAGTKILRDIGKDAKSGITFDSTVVKAGSGVYFEAPSTSGNIVLWRTNGTTAGTGIVANGMTHVRLVEAFSDSLIVAGVKGDNPARLYRQTVNS